MLAVCAASIGASAESGSGGGVAAAGEETGPFRIAAIMSGPRGDRALNQSLYDSLRKLRQEMGSDAVDFTLKENVTDPERAVEAIRGYAEEGYDLIVAHGPGYDEPLRQIAPSFPHTSFATGTSLRSLGMSNVFNYGVAAEQGGYVNGVLAATLTKSRVVGVVAPFQRGDAKLYVDGFVAGARATDPTVEVQVNYTGSANDFGKATAAAQAHLAAGADVLTGTGKTVMGPIAVGAQGGAIWFANETDQAGLAPKSVVSSQVYDWTAVLTPMVSAIKRGTRGGRTFLSTLGNGGLVMKYNDDFPWPKGVMSRALESELRIYEGAVEIETSAPVPMGGGGGPLTFGLILTGKRDDGGWNQAQYEGGRFVEAEMPGAHMLLFEGLNPEDSPDVRLSTVVDEMVAKGAKMIITGSWGLGDGTIAAARKHSSVVFVHVSGDAVLRRAAPANFGNLMGRISAMHALNGCAAALATKRGQIAYVGAKDYSETRRMATAAYLGARHCWQRYRARDADSLRFELTWLGFWFHLPGVTTNPVALVGTMIDRGADVLLSGIDSGEPLAVAAARSTTDDPLLAAPQGHYSACDAAPQACLGVAYFNWGPAFLEAGRAVQAGGWQRSFEWREPYWIDIQDDTRTVVGWRPGVSLSPETRAQIEEFTAELASGEVDLWAGPLNLVDGSEYVPEGKSATDMQVWYLPKLVRPIREVDG